MKKKNGELMKILKPKEISELKHSLNKTLNELEEITKLYLALKNKIMAGLDAEQALPINTMQQSVSLNLTRAAQLLGQSVRMKIEMGFIRARSIWKKIKNPIYRWMTRSRET